MWNLPTPGQLARMPGLYCTETTPCADKRVYLHFFTQSCDWYACEYDPHEHLFWGFVNLGDDRNAEWGYFSFEELRAYTRRIGVNGRGMMMQEIDREVNWRVKRAGEIRDIARAQGWTT